MAMEAIEDQPLSPAVASRQNGEALAEATPTSEIVLATALAERIEELERQQRQLKRDSLLIAGLTTIAAASGDHFLAATARKPKRRWRIFSILPSVR